MTHAQTKTDATPEFILSRHFNAPRALVWKAWTDPKMFAQWFGPKGSKTRTIKMDVRPGGITHAGIKMEGTPELFGKLIYREVTEPSRLVWIHGFADEAGNPAHHPFDPAWPLTLLTTITFAEEKGGTRVTLSWVPYEATPEETAVFAAGMESMNQGWGGTFDQLEAFLQ